MLKTILNRQKPQAENIIAEEKAAFRHGRSTIEHIFNLRIMCEKTSPTSEKHLTHVHRLQEGLRQRMTRGTMGNNEKVQHQREAH